MNTIYHVSSTKQIDAKAHPQLRGSGKIIEWLKRAAPKLNNFLKSSKIISRIGDAAINFAPPQYRGLADSALAGVKSLGYGRRRTRGRGLKTSGGALRLAGSRYY